MSQISSDSPQAAAAEPAAEATPLAGILAQGRAVDRHAPWPRIRVGAVEWTQAAGELAAGRCSLVALWGEAAAVHMALHEAASGLFAIVSFDCPDRRYPSVAQWHAPALRLERAARDLFGLEPQGLADTRPWLDHDRWGLRHPLGSAPQKTEEATPLAPYAFLAAEGEGLHQIPVGPVHAGIIEPGHFRFTASGEAVVRLEARLGYVHKGIEGLMAGADLTTAARLAGRVSGDSTVAYALAFARAAEAALGIEAPPRAQALRAVMAELERIANHIGDVGAICNDASFALMHAHCGVLRERVLRASDAAFGHRLMRDRIVPGGVTADLVTAGIEALRAVVAEFRRRFPELVELYENTASLQDRTVGTGFLPAELAARFGAGGYVGRASGRSFDARKSPGYAPYADFGFDVPVLVGGDVHARVMVRIAEIGASLGLIEALLARLPDGPIAAELPAAAGAAEGATLVEGFRGDIFVWLRLGADGRVVRGHLRDPSWFQWPLLEVAIDGNIVADFPLCNKSFNCSYSGHDL